MPSRILFLCVALLILPSCIYVQRYPAGWSPPVASEAACPDIAGVYDNHGEGAGGDKARLALALVPTWEMVYERSITHTEIAQPGDDTMKVTFWSDNAVTAEKMYSKAAGEFYCDAGGIVIDQPAHRALSKFLLGVNWGWDRLAVNSAGDLVLREKSSGIGLFAVIPVAEVDWLWFRFKKNDREENVHKHDAPEPKTVR